MIRIALYQPEIAPNVGAMIRVCACMGVGLDVIEPCGFPWDDRKIRKSAMDYMTKVNYTLHSSWQTFRDAYPDRRIILMTTKASEPYTDFEYQDGDILLAGRESAGVPQDVHDTVQGRVCIPMRDGARSMNIVNATSMILGETLRQVKL